MAVNSRSEKFKLDFEPAAPAPAFDAPVAPAFGASVTPAFNAPIFGAPAPDFAILNGRVAELEKQNHRMKKAMDFPRVGIAAILIRDDQKILLGKRKSAHGAGKYAFPGGHLESTESWAECAKRECEEETNLIVDKPFELVTVTNDVMPEEGRHYVTCFMQASVKSTQRVSNMEPDKCEGWGWFTWEQIAAMKPDQIFVPIQNLIKSGCAIQRQWR
jgi:8-oxo-dGTP diphosphatase